MRTAGVLLASAAALVVLAAACAWALPPLLDWSRFRDSAETLASSRLGRPVAIAGPISLSLLPEPVLTAGQVSVGEIVEGGGGSFAARSLRMQVALAPLLSGRIEARELVLQQPVLRLPWPVPPGLLAARPAAWSDGFTARIENGAVTIGALAIDAINASLGTDADGTLSAGGVMRIDQQPWQFATRLGSQDKQGAASFNLALDGRERRAGLGMTLSGQLAADGTFDGRIAARGPDLARLGPAPALPFRAEGRFSAGEGLAAAKDLLLDLGGSAAGGDVILRVGPAARLDVVLRANRLDLDQWGPRLVQGRGGGLPMNLDLSAETATLSRGLLKHLRAVVELQPEAVGISAASAVLPGEATLRLAGQIASANSFEGDVTLAAPDLRTFLNWLQASQPGLRLELPPTVLQSATLSGRVAVRPDRISVENLRGSLDGAAVRGSCAVRTGPVLGVTADLDVDRMDLDPFLPARIPASASVFEWLQSANAEVTLRAAKVTGRGRDANEATLTATLNDGHLDLKTLAATVEGIHARLSGSVDSRTREIDVALHAAGSDAGPLGSWIGRPELDLWRGPLTLRATAKGGPPSLGINLSAELADARVAAAPTVDGTTGRWRGALTLRHPGARRFVNAAGFGPALGLAGTGDWLGEGSLSLVAQMSGEPGRVSADSFDLRAGDLHTAGTLTLMPATDAPRLVGKLTAETLPLPAFDPHSGDPLPVRALRGWQASLQVSADTVLAGLSPVADHASAEISVDAGAVRVEKLRAGVRDGEISGQAVLDGASTPPSAALHVGWSGIALAPTDSLPLVTSGRAGGAADLTGSGYSPSALLATARGAVSLHVTDGTLSGMDLPALRASLAESDEHADARDLEAQVRQALRQGTTPFSTVDAAGRLAGGDIHLSDLRLEAASGRVVGSGDVSITGAAVDLQLRMQPDLPGGPEIGVRVSGPIAGPASHPDLTALAAWLGERPPAPAISPR